MVHLIPHRDRHRSDDHTSERTYADEGTHTPRGVHADEHATVVHHDRARQKFGGVNVGAGFAGWLVAIALTVLLTSVVGAVATAIGTNTNLTQGEVEREAGTIGLAAAIALVAVMMIAYYFGGYVAGRMSRFDGAKQGVLVWAIGLVVTIIAVVLGVIFGDQYNLLDRVDLPRFPIPTDAATWGGVITGVVLLLGTLLAAMVGGKVGHRYHDRVDRAAYF